MTNTSNSSTLWVVDGARALAKTLREGGAQTRVVGYTGTKSNSGS